MQTLLKDIRTIKVVGDGAGSPVQWFVFEWHRCHLQEMVSTVLPTSARLRVRSVVAQRVSSFMHGGRSHTASIFVPISPLDRSKGLGNWYHGHNPRLGAAVSCCRLLISFSFPLFGLLFGLRNVLQQHPVRSLWLKQVVVPCM